jgi:hypothetical protein
MTSAFMRYRIPDGRLRAPKMTVSEAYLLTLFVACGIVRSRLSLRAPLDLSRLPFITASARAHADR